MCCAGSERPLLRVSYLGRTRPYASERVTRGKVERSIDRTIGAIGRNTPSNSVLAVLADPFLAPSIIRHDEQPFF